MKKNNFDKNINISEEDAATNAVSSSNKSKIIYRKCISCGKIMPRGELLRIMKCHDTKEIIINPTSKQFGRSAYLCYNRDCFKKAIKKKILQKIFKKELPESTMKKLESVLN